MNVKTQNPKGKILVIRGGAIGDFILTLPVLAALREQFPHAHLEVLGYPHIAQLALAGGLADQVQSIEARALAGFFARNGSLDEKLARYFSSFSLALSFLYDPDEIFSSNFASCSKAQFIAGPHRPNEEEARHATEVFLKPLERLAIFNANPIPRLDLSVSQPPRASTDPSEATQAGGGAAATEGGCSVAERLAVHPGSGSEKKNWPEANWAELLQRLAGATDWDFLLIGGEAEGERLARLAPLLPAGRLQVAQSRPLVELANELGQCNAYLGHDSGISHLAAAVGLHGLLLWGETNAHIWSPRSGRMRLVQEPRGLTELSVERVMGGIRALSRRGPCTS